MIDGAVLKEGWRRGRHGWPARYPIAQVPNAPLMVAIGGWLTGELASGAVRGNARAVFYAGLSAWAWGELAGGANLFRRALGLGGLAYVIGAVGAALGPNA